VQELEKKINDSLKEALKAQDKVKTLALRMLVTEINNKKIELGSKDKPLDDGTLTALVQKLARRYKESIDQFEKGDRSDLASKEKAELAVLKEYLPEELSAEELEKIVSSVIKETGASTMKDMGKVMKAVQEQVKGRADGKTISQMVKEKLIA